jgi:hypothetical protein
MDLADPIRLPRLPLEPLDADLTEVDAAITLVCSGVATRVRLVGLRHPDGVVATALARSQSAGVAFETDRSGGGLVFTIGPVLTNGSAD